MKKFIYRLLILLTATNFQSAAQPKRTDVLVVGGTAAGTGAAIQAAHSGVKAVLLEESGQLGADISVVDTANTLGLQRSFYQLYLKGVTSATTNKPSIPSTLYAWTDTVANLDVFFNTRITSIKKKGKGWKVRLSNGSKIRVHAVVDATANRTVASMLNLANSSTGASISSPNELYTNNLYRTHVAIAGRTAPISSAPIRSFIPASVQNLIILPQSSGSGTINTSNLISGQAGGAIAAYLAFFKTNTNNMNIRMVQGELLNYKSSLLNFHDINSLDTNLIAIEHIGATGMLKGSYSAGRLLFEPEKPVSIDEIRNPFKEYYSRSQLWFADHKTNTMTINDLLSLIKFAGTRGEELNRDVERNWKTTFNFRTPFDLKRTATRREFAVLVDQYLKPFNVRVDFSGRALY